MNSILSDYVIVRDPAFMSKHGKGNIPISTLFEAYIHEAVDLRSDIFALLANRYRGLSHRFTWEHVTYFTQKFLPEALIHSKSADEKLVRGHYDRGDDFFAAFLGPRMVYTSGYFTNKDQTLEEGQDQKLDLVCRKLNLKNNDNFLDIGCGWGTLALHAAKHYGVRSTGVTLSKNQAAFGNKRIADAGLSDKAKILCLDYREIPALKYNKISSLEMVEHVGVRNLNGFYEKVSDLLHDDGLFLLQWTGLRRATSQEDLVWGLFMAKYIFPGADASLPLAPMMNYCEKAAFEIQSVENLSTHYRYTIEKWHTNWLEHKDEIVASYGERWFRIWNVFLAWATVIAGQGTAACFQVVMNKNRNDFDREQFIGAPLFGNAGLLPQRNSKQS